MKKCTVCQQEKPFSEFYAKNESSLKSECKACFRERMGRRHQRHKITLVQEAGGKCSRCGYDRDPRVLNFHHLDPNQKDFGIAKRLSANLEVLRQEVAKCVLLCPNCHQEHHLGLW